MTLYLIRHGQSVANRDHLAAGWGEFPLTEAGVMQAKRLGERLREQPPFDKIYVSDLVRTRQTFEHVFGADTPHTLCPLIREIGAPFAGEPFALNDARFGEPYRKARREMDYGAFGGESAQSMMERVKKFRDLLEQENLDRVAAVCHAGVIRTFLALTMGVSNTQVLTRTANCSVSVFERVETGEWRLVQFNHTPELL